MAAAISKARKAVADGVFYAELNELLMRELGGEGYSGVEVRVTPMRTEVIIRATRTQNVLGVKGRRIRELTSVVQKRFKFPEGSVELYAEKVANRGLCAVAQAESMRYKLLGGLAVRRACYGVLRFVMESGAKGCAAMPVAEPLLLAGSVAGIAGLTFLSFTAVSYLEVKNKIDAQIARGEDPYELRVPPKQQQRAQPPVKRASGGKKKGGAKRK